MLAAGNVFLQRSHTVRVLSVTLWSFTCRKVTPGCHRCILCKRGCTTKINECAMSDMLYAARLHHPPGSANLLVAFKLPFMTSGGRTDIQNGILPIYSVRLWAMCADGVCVRVVLFPFCVCLGTGEMCFRIKSFTFSSSGETADFPSAEAGASLIDKWAS